MQPRPPPSQAALRATTTFSVVNNLKLVNTMPLSMEVCTAVRSKVDTTVQLAEMVIRELGVSDLSEPKPGAYGGVTVIVTTTGWDG